MQIALPLKSANLYGSQPRAVLGALFVQEWYVGIVPALQ